MNRLYYIIIVFFLYIRSIYGIPFNNSRNLVKGELLLCGGGYADSGENFGIITGMEYGMNKYFLPIMKLGYINNDFYGGVEGKMVISTEFGGVDYLSIITGIHYNSDAGIDISLLSGNLYKNFDIYFGLDGDMNFKDSIEYPANFLIGVVLKPFRDEKGLLVELGIPITSFSYYQLGAVLRFDL